MKNRYYVKPRSGPMHDEDNRRWTVWDRERGLVVQFCHTRAEARRAAHEGNELEEADRG